MATALMRDLDEHVLMLGKFWGNFNSLELILRVYLAKMYGEKDWGLDLKVGEKVPASHVTNYDSFATIVGKFNATAPKAKRIDAGEIVSLRDALAHGRVTAKGDAPMIAVKFGRVDQATGEVVVEFKQELTNDYMQARVTQVRELLLHVHRMVEDEFGG